MPRLPVQILIFICTLLFAPLGWGELAGQLNLNTARAEQLELLPAIGSVRARAMVAYRERHGPFASLDRVRRVPGIGPKSLQTIRRYLKLQGQSDLHLSELTAPRNPPMALGAAGFDLAAGDLQILADDRYFPTLLGRIAQAKQSIDLAMYVFLVNPDHAENRPLQIVQALLAAKDRGVAVRVVMELAAADHSINDSNRAAVAALAAGGIAVRFDAPDTTSHMKMAVIDGRYSLLGSHNLTQSALKYNRELSVLIDDPAVARELRAYIDRVVDP